MQNTSQKLTLYVDGACRGNPGGIGGWGALILDEHAEQREIFGGQLDTTNNRMELTAAIEGILACDINAELTIYTDSTYVQKGITEWIIGWKKKNWKDVKNPDLWKKLDHACQGRQIAWHWIKGHAGHEGNERADQLANLGADQATHSSKVITPTAQTTTDITADNASNNNSTDWLLDDPFGLDMSDTELLDEDLSVEDADLSVENEYTDALESTASLALVDPNTPPSNQLSANTLNTSVTPNPTEHPAIKITPVSYPQEGERLLILDTETTGFYYQDTDRIIEVGAIEMVNRRLTGSSIHIYIKPDKPVGESENIHGISDEFLKDKPAFKEIAQTLYDYLKGAEIVAHNATFDMNFLNMEFERVGLGKLSQVCTVTDTLAIAKRKYPGQKNSLDALVRRLEVPARDRTFHGALLDAEILADVYLAMTGGQVKLDIDHSNEDEQHAQQFISEHRKTIDIPLISPSAKELQAHEMWMKKFQEKNQHASLFEQYTST